MPSSLRTRGPTVPLVTVPGGSGVKPRHWGESHASGDWSGLCDRQRTPPASGPEQLPQRVTPWSMHRGVGPVWERWSRRGRGPAQWPSWTEFLPKQTPRCERAWLIQYESPGDAGRTTED